MTKYRLKWDIYNREWLLQSDPCTSSAWDTVARSKFKRVLRIRAAILTYTARQSDRIDELNKTEYL